MFSFQGRIKRSQWWAVFGIQMLVIIAVAVPLGLFADAGDPMAEPEISPVALIIILPIYFVLVWMGLASTIKRCHDRNKSGWWIFIALVLIIGGIWALVENGCLGGVDAGNRFGPKPE